MHGSIYAFPSTSICLKYNIQSYLIRKNYENILGSFVHTLTPFDPLVNISCCCLNVSFLASEIPKVTTRRKPRTVTAFRKRSRPLERWKGGKERERAKDVLVNQSDHLGFWSTRIAAPNPGHLKSKTNKQVRTAISKKARRTFSVFFFLKAFYECILSAVFSFGNIWLNNLNLPYHGRTWTQRTNKTIPTDPFTLLEPQNQSIDDYELHKVCLPPDFEALLLWKGRSGYTSVRWSGRKKERRLSLLRLHDRPFHNTRDWKSGDRRFWKT